MKKVLLITITLTAIGIGVRATKKEKSKLSYGPILFFGDQLEMVGNRIT